jgi:signal transduction histidine kinase
LPPGHYTLEVQAISPNGLVSIPQTLKLHVQKPYYETWWFFLCCLFCVSLLIYAAHAYRVYQLKKEQRIRRQLADDLHDNIGNKLNIISILAQKIANKPSNVPDDGKNTALRKLVAASRDTLSALHIMIWAVDAKKNRLSDLITRMQDFADDYLIPLQIQCAFSIPGELPSANLKLKIRHHLILLYQETLTNMVKHSNPEKIAVQIRLVDGVHLWLGITATLNRQTGTETHTTFSSNRGEESIKHRLQQINGRLELRESNSGQQKLVFYISNIFE